MYSIFTRSSVRGHLDCIHVLAIVNSTAINMYLFFFFWLDWAFVAAQRAFSRCPAHASHFGDRLVEQRLSGCGLQWLWHKGLICSVVCEIFPDQGSSPGSLLWQVGSYPLDYQEVLYLFELEFFLDICPRVRLLDHMTVLFLVFMMHLPTVLYSGCTSLHSHQEIRGFSFLHMLSSIYYL